MYISRCVLKTIKNGSEIGGFFAGVIDGED